MSVKSIKERLDYLLAEDFDNRTNGKLPLYREHRIFTNRNIKLSRMQAIGFDMDFTLAQYHQDALDTKTMELALQHMVNDKGYPEGILSIKYKPDFAIRGLIIDTELGNVLKMDKFRYVSLAYHGLKTIHPDQRAELYNIMRINISSNRFQPVDTLFELLETYLYAALIDYLEDAGKLLDFKGLYDDLRGAIDLCHKDDSLKKAIMADPKTYIRDDPKLIPALHQFREMGKRLFVLTNSEPHYTDFVLSHLFRDAAPYFQDWRACFDIVGAFAGKPGFFTQGKPEEIIEEIPALFFSGGNIEFLEKRLGVQPGRILYVGDHIYGDILKSKHNSSWRTCIIVPELNFQIRAEEDAKPHLQSLMRNESRHKQLTMELNWRRTHLQQLHQFKEAEADELDMESLTEIDRRIASLNRQLEDNHQELSKLLFESRQLRRKISSSFNPYWGRLFKTGGQLSMFAEQIRDYACIYTSSVSNFSYYNNNSYLASTVSPMPHEKNLYPLGDLNFDASMEVNVSPGLKAFPEVVED
ncbi:MAG: HAD-IG family 5'-nucleotidase [Acidobacteriota bacterium]|nr:HAD-IG family 5'-nucleotidase [Acidobacteriota bacterium]